MKNIGIKVLIEPNNLKLQKQKHANANTSKWKRGWFTPLLKTKSPPPFAPPGMQKKVTRTNTHIPPPPVAAIFAPLVYSPSTSTPCLAKVHGCENILLILTSYIFKPRNNNCHYHSHPPPHQLQHWCYPPRVLQLPCLDGRKRSFHSPVLEGMLRERLCTVRKRLLKSIFIEDLLRYSVFLGPLGSPSYE